MVSSIRAEGFPSAVEDSSSKSLFELKWLTSKEAAFLLRTSAGQIRNLVWCGRLKAYRACVNGIEGAKPENLESSVLVLAFRQ